MLSAAQIEPKNILEKARERYNSRDYVVAVKLCNYLLNQNPQSLDALFVRGCSHLELGQYKDAVQDLEVIGNKSAPRKVKYKDFRYFYAKALQKHITKSAVDINYWQVNANKIISAYDLAYKEAKPYLSIFLSEDEKHKLFDIHYSRAAFGFYAIHACSRALEDINAALKLKPTDAMAHCWKGKILLKSIHTMEGRYQKELQEDPLPYFQAAIKLNPNIAELYYDFALAMKKMVLRKDSKIDLKMHSKAMKNALRKAIQLRPDYQDAMMLLVEYEEVKDNNYNEIIELCSKTIGFDTDPESYSKLISAQMAVGQYHEALAHCNTALAKWPKVDFYSKLFNDRKFEILQKTSTATELVEHLNNDNNQTPLQKAIILENIKKYDEAIAEYKKIIESDLKSFSTYLAIAKIYYNHKNQIPEAKQSLNFILENAPVADGSLYECAEMFEKMGDLKSAMRAYEKCDFATRDVAPNPLEYWYSSNNNDNRYKEIPVVAQLNYKLAKLEFMFGRYQTANNYFNRAMQASNPPSSPWQLSIDYYDGYAKIREYFGYIATINTMSGYSEQAENNYRHSDLNYSLNKAYLHYKNKAFGDALSSLYQTDTISQIYKGRTLLKQNKFEESFKTFQAYPHFESYYYTGVFYEQGLAVPISFEKSKNYYKQTLEKISYLKNDPIAIYRLGTMYHAGRGVPCDPEQAKLCYREVTEMPIHGVDSYQHYIRLKANKRLQQLDDAKTFERTSNSYFKHKIIGEPMSELMKIKKQVSEKEHQNDLLNIPYNEIIWDMENGIRKELGRGSFGIVYAGQWNKFDLAVKEFNEKAGKTPLVEKQLLTKYRHRHIIPLFGVSMANGTNLCIIMPKMKCSLYKVIHANPQYQIHLPTIIRQMHEIVLGLEYLHNNQIAHYDIKSLNILIHPDNNSLLIADFGTAELIKDGENNKRALGTPYWMAPEHLRGEPSLQSDVYSLGMIGFELCNQAVPSKGMDYAQIKSVREQTDEPVQLNPKIQSELPRFAGLVISMWQRHPNSRPSATVIVKELDALQRDNANTGIEDGELVSVIPDVDTRSQLSSHVPSIRSTFGY